MTRTLCRIELSVTLRAPWLVQGSDPGRFGLDATLLRNHHGLPILPGTLVAGRVHDAWTELRGSFELAGGEGGGDPATAVIPEPETWFGRDAAADSFSPRQARLMVDDLTCRTSTPAARFAHRIQISEAEAAAVPGALMVAEQEHAPGTEVEFAGTWRAWIEAEKEKLPLERALRAGLLWQSQLGAERSIGFGEVLKAEVQVVPCHLPKDGGGDPKDVRRRMRLRLRFDGPVAVDVKGRRGNLFVSGDIVPGAAIKAALARALGAACGRSVGEIGAKDLFAAHIDAIRISHAFPASDPDLRPSRLPLSLVALKGDVRDAALCVEPRLLDGRAPSFQIDWKEEAWSAAGRAQGWGETDVHLRIRTAIDRTTRRAADEKLFAYECKVPRNDTVWLADVDVPEEVGDSELPQLWAALRRLVAHGIGPVGKTDAWAQCELLDDCRSVWMPKGKLEAPFVVQLQTPALLFPADEVADKTEFDLLSLYRGAFADRKVSDGALKLSHFFASQSLSGGEYLWRRFLKPRGGAYLPYVLTDAGSVFVLHPAEGRESDASDAIKHWLTRGLPLPSPVAKRYGSAWNENPFIPQNGFGEVAVNLCHGFRPLGD